MDMYLAGCGFVAGWFISATYDNPVNTWRDWGLVLTCILLSWVGVGFIMAETRA